MATLQHIVLITLLLGAAHSAAQQTTPEASSLEGVVVDAVTGLPLSGVSVMAPEPPWLPDPAPFALSFPIIQTDSDGHFLRENIFGREGRGLISFTKSGYDSALPAYTFVPGQRVTNVVVRMQPVQQGVVSGRVFEANGNPAIGVPITPYRFVHGKDLVSGQGARTDDRGEFRLFDLKPNLYVIQIGVAAGAFYSNPTQAPVLYPGVGEVAKAEVVEVEDKRETRLRDIALGQRGLGRVRLHLINGGEPAKDIVMSINGVRIGDGRIYVEAGADLWRDYWPNRPTDLEVAMGWNNPDGSPSYSSTTILFDGSDRDAEIVLSKAHGVLNIHAVTEQNDGTTVPFSTTKGIRLCARSSKCELYAPGTSSGISIASVGQRSSPALGQDGKTSLTGVVVGQYDLYRFDLPANLYLASARQGDHDALIDGITVSNEPSTLEIRLRSGAGTLQGRVVNRQGQVVKDVTVVLLPEPPLGRKLWSLQRMDLTDQNGRFEMRGIIPGQYRVSAGLGVETDVVNSQTLVYIDPVFALTVRERGTPVSIEENGRATLDLTIP